MISLSSNPLKILFITRAHGLNQGGMERLNFELINNLKEQPGIEAQTLAHSGSRMTSPLFVFTVIPRAIAAAKQADVIHLGDPMLSITGWLASKFSGKPVAVNVHGLDISYRNPLYQLYLKLFFTKFGQYFPISDHVNKLLGRRNITGRRTVITPGLTDRYFDQAFSRPIKPNQITLFTSGRLVKRKGHAWFITNVMPKLPDHIYYTIAGSGPEINRIKQAIDNVDLGSHVHLLGHIAEPELKKLYNSIDAFIQPNISVSNDVEGFGLVMLEAALCQRPVFASNIDGIPSAIQDQRNGYLLKSRDAEAWATAIQHFVSHPEKYKVAGQAARQYTLQNFSWSDISAKHIQALILLR